jgi:glycolate oxidase iron-sulfur subunit
MHDAEHLRSVTKDCVHCGFCLPACPTYQLWAEEMDSPRGRIYLVNQILDGAELTAAAAEHFDRCLGCMACMTACPSGVQYDQLIEAARVWTEEARASGEAVSAVPAVDAGSAESSGSSGSSGVGRASAVGGAAGVGGTAEFGAAAGLAGSAASAWSAGARRRDRAARAAIFALFPYPARLRAMMGPLRAAQRTGLDRRLARSGLPDRLSPALGAALRLAPAASATKRLPERVAARGPRRAVVGMLTGCVQSVFFPQVNAATARVLAAEGCDVLIPRSQGCCGALSLHAGREAEAQAFARSAIETFERDDVDAIVVNSAGCGSAMKEYERLLAGQDGPDGPDAGWGARAAALSAKVRDLSEFLAELGPAARRHPLPVTAAYHDACHLAHAQRITKQPRELLRAIPELTLVELPDAGTCCGSAGVYNLLQPEAASELGARKAQAVLEVGAPLLVSANPGCSLQIASALGDRGAHIAVAHVAQVLDASICGTPLPRPGGAS